MDELENLEREVGVMPTQDFQSAPMDIGMGQEQASFSQAEKQEAIQALQQIQQVIEQMLANGASEEEINQFLEEIGLTIEDLEFLEQTLMSEEVTNQMVM
jgi:uncharacterized membrane protein YccC